MNVYHGEIRFAKAVAWAKIPDRKTKLSAGLDLYPADNFTLQPGERITIDTGIIIAHCPEYVFFRIEARSRSWKQNIHTFPGIIDSDYRGTIKVGIQNTSDAPFLIRQDEAIAQLVCYPLTMLFIRTTDEITPSERGDSGGINNSYSEE